MSIDIMGYQSLAIFPSARACVDIRGAKVDIGYKMTRTHQLLVAMMDVARTLVSKDSTRLLTWVTSMM